jgi:hypothetical protein
MSFVRRIATRDKNFVPQMGNIEKKRARTIAGRMSRTGQK